MTYCSIYNGKTLKTINNPHPEMHMVQKHIILLPELCPASKNPVTGSTLTIKYQAGQTLLELFALEDYIQGFIGHTIVRDLEYFVQVVAKDCAQVLGYNILVKAHIKLAGLAQEQKITVKTAL